jgi:hypothetical protein
MWPIMRTVVVFPLVPVTATIGIRDGAPGGKPFTQDVVGARADKRADPGLVASADEDPRGVAEHGGRRVPVGIGPAAEAQFPGVFDAEFAEHPLVLGVHLVRHAGGGGDQRDPGPAAAAQVDEPFEHPGAAARVLTTADDQQAAKGHSVMHLLVHGAFVTQSSLLPTKR